MNHPEDTHTSIRIAFPRGRCGEVRDVIEVLFVLEDVYNHLYAWHELVYAADGGAKNAQGLRSLPEIADASDMVPADRRLCLARVEIEAPAFIEVVGARYPLDVIYNYLRHRGNGNGHKKARAIERIEAVRGEIDHLCESTVPGYEIQEAVALHVIAPFKRLERLEGIQIYGSDEPGKASAPWRGRSDRPAAALSPLAREH
ncbi:MAG TPA: hypothetical protein VI231_12685 [Candidatus Binatia bacterium]|jgi:hypothetical protein